MGTMDIIEHSARTVSAPLADGSGSKSTVVHAHVWMRVVTAEGEVRERHAHLIRELHGGDWREVDLRRLPLAPLAVSGSGPEPVLPSTARESLASFLAGWQPALYRVAATGQLSELDEPLDSFRSRVLSVVRPTLQARIQKLRESPTPGGAAEVQERTRMAAEMHELSTGIESVTTPTALEAARLVELGILVVPPGVVVPSLEHGRSNLMVEDGPPVEGL